MIIKTAEQANDRLADTIWWLKGFAAAHRPTGTGDHFDLDPTGAAAQAEALVEVRFYINRITEPPLPPGADDEPF